MSVAVNNVFQVIENRRRVAPASGRSRLRWPIIGGRIQFLADRSNWRSLDRFPHFSRVTMVTRHEDFQVSLIPETSVSFFSFNGRSDITIPGGKSGGRLQCYKRYWYVLRNHNEVRLGAT